jgi:hypothetical protein
VKKKSLEKSNYHLRQFLKPYFSTIAFEDFLSKSHIFKNKTQILDMGAGCGANIYYLAQKHPDINFVGADYNQDLVVIGEEILKKYNLPNTKLEHGDWFKLPKQYLNKFDGIVTIHTLCCFKKLDKALSALIKLQPRWIAFNSLFYEGPLDVLIHIREHKLKSYSDDNPDGDFNIFSLPIMKKFFFKHGFKKFKFEKFRIPVELPKPKTLKRGTYTLKTEFDEHAMFSGPVYLPWYFVVASK